MTLVLASHLPGAGHFRSERFDVVGIECADPLDYWRGVEAHWDSDESLVIVEHDMEVSDELIQTLLECPHELCSWAYWLNAVSGGPHWAHRTGRLPPCGGVWIEPGDEWADYGGVGFAKVTPEARVRPLPEQTWQFVDCAVAEATDARWHLHWREGPDGLRGVEHFHE